MLDEINKAIGVESVEGTPPSSQSDLLQDQALAQLRSLVTALEQRRIVATGLGIEQHMDHLSAGGGVFPVPNGVHTLTLTFAEC